MGSNATKINYLNSEGMKKRWSGKNQIMTLNQQRESDKMMDPVWCQLGEKYTGQNNVLQDLVYALSQQSIYSTEFYGSGRQNFKDVPTGFPSFGYSNSNLGTTEKVICKWD